MRGENTFDRTLSCRTPRQVAVASVVLVRQHPGTAKGVMFMTIEDETGRLDLIVRRRIYERDRSAAIHSQFIVAHGRVERNGLVVHVLPSRIESISDSIAQLPQTSRDFH